VICLQRGTMLPCEKGAAKLGRGKFVKAMQN